MPEDGGSVIPQDSVPEWAKPSANVQESPGPRVAPIPGVDPLFRVHMLNSLGLKKAAEIAAAFNDCLFRLQGMCPPGREFAIVKTKLEEAAFFAKKSMANELENQA